MRPVRIRLGPRARFFVVPTSRDSFSDNGTHIRVGKPESRRVV